MRIKTFVAVVAAALFTCAANAYALPTFQLSASGGTYGTQGSDQDTWFSGAVPLTLMVAGAFGQADLLDNVRLVVSVPQGEQGTISVTSGTDGNPSMLTSGADVNLLTDVAGNDGFSVKSFLPENFNEHYPFKDDISNFLLFDLGSFDDDELVGNYNDAGEAAKAGEEKLYLVSYTGFSRLHFDLYGRVGTQKNNGSWDYKWELNPGSHDVTSTDDGGGPPQDVVPEPSTLLLLNSGILGLWVFRKRK